MLLTIGNRVWKEGDKTPSDMDLSERFQLSISKDGTTPQVLISKAVEELYNQKKLRNAVR